MEIDIQTLEDTVCVHIHLCLLAHRTSAERWYNTPAIQQTRLFTCELTLSLQLLKYVVSNYWNMYGTSVPRNTVSPAFVHPASNQKYYNTSRLRGLTMQSHQTVRGIGTMSGEQRHLTLSHLSPSAWKWRKYKIWICLRCASSTGALFVCWAGPLIDRLLPLGKCSMAVLQPKANTLNYWKSARNSCCFSKREKRGCRSDFKCKKNPPSAF